MCTNCLFTKFAKNMSRTMSKISIETVVRANERTIRQNRNQYIRYGSATMSNKEVNVSVSVMGVVYSRTITTQQIKDSFNKALNIHVKKL